MTGPVPMLIRDTTRVMAAALVLCLAACSTDDPTPEAPGGPTGADGAADGLVGDVAAGKAEGWSAIDVELGGSYRYSVVAKQGDKVTPEHAKVLRFTVEAGRGFAAVMRRTDTSELDAFLGLYEALPNVEAARVASSQYEQALVPMAVERDAAVVHTAVAGATYMLFASDRELAVTGSFQIDLLAVDLPPLDPALEPSWAEVDLSVTNPALRAYVEEMRTAEPEVTAFVARGALSEGPDGLLVTDEAALDSLQERHQLRLLANRQNELRAWLFAEFVNTTTGGQDATLVGRVGATCGAVWGPLRTEQHAMP